MFYEANTAKPKITFLQAIKLDTKKSEQAHFELGKVYCTQHKLPEGEKELKKSDKHQ